MITCNSILFKVRMECAMILMSSTHIFKNSGNWEQKFSTNAGIVLPEKFQWHLLRGYFGRLFVCIENQSPLPVSLISLFFFFQLNSTKNQDYKLHLDIENKPKQTDFSSQCFFNPTQPYLAFGREVVWFSDFRWA